MIAIDGWEVCWPERQVVSHILSPLIIFIVTETLESCISYLLFVVALLHTIVDEIRCAVINLATDSAK